MLHLIVIALFIVIAIHDSLFGPLSAGDRAAAPWWVWAASLGPMALLAAGLVLVLWSLARELARRGSWRTALTAERMFSASRWVALVIHAFNILVVGYLDAVRALTGDIVLIDELIAMAPALAVLIIGWWAYYPIDLQLREATTLRELDAGQPMYPPLTRAGYVKLQVRHQVLLSLVPIGMILAWSELVERALRWLTRLSAGSAFDAPLWRWLRDDSARGWVQAALQLIGIALVFALSPLVLRRVWDTVALGPGPFRDRLMRICAGGNVRVRELLIWRTHGTMLNGAVIGLIAPLRYILLTDALLDRLHPSQVEAVMAHEVGHARHAHMPWLAGGLLAGFGGAALLLSVVAWLAVTASELTGQRDIVEALIASPLGATAILLASLTLGLVWFGFVSRRFEWQADAFAVKQLSRDLPPPEPTLWDPADRRPSPGPIVHPDAVAAMTSALGAVADLNHISPTQFSWRHGSIALRQRRLRTLTGRPLEKLPIDRAARRVKIVIALGLVILVALAVAESMLAPSPPADGANTSDYPIMPPAISPAR